MARRLPKLTIGLSVGTAAAVAIVMVLTGVLTPRRALSAAEVLDAGVQATKGYTSVKMKARMRGLPRDNFVLIGTEYDFIDIEMCKTVSPKTQWRIEKSGRVIVTDKDAGESTMLMKPGVAMKVTGDGPARWLARLLDVDDVLTRETSRARSEDATLTVKEALAEDNSTQLVVTIETPSVVGGNDYLHNRFLDTSDTRRVYRFDAHTLRLEGLAIYIDAEGEDVLVFEVTSIEFDAELDDSRFTLDIPASASWIVEPEILPDNDIYAAMTPREAATAFFQACADRDGEEMLKFTNIRPGGGGYPYSILFGIEILDIGVPFQSGGYIGWFIPYQVKLTSGSVKKHNMAMRKDNAAQRWIVDGGI